MAWRPTEFLVEGELDNSVPQKIVGWIRFEGLQHPVELELKGDFHADIRGACIRFRGGGKDVDKQKALKYMQGFSVQQTGKAGDITGDEDNPLCPCPYVEWYSDQNGRVVLELRVDRFQRSR